MSNVSVTSNKNEIDHLAEEHGLIKVAAFIHSNTAKQRTKGAERVAKHRQQKKDSGLVQVDVPILFAEEIKTAGSFEVWKKDLYHVPQQRLISINLALATYRKVAKLHPWLRYILGL